MGLAQSLLRLAGWLAGDYTPLDRRQKSLSVNLGGRSCAGGLRLLIDSTGIKMIGEDEWKAKNTAFPTAASGARCISALRRLLPAMDAAGW
jgi:hypothetical protein